MRTLLFFFIFAVICVCAVGQEVRTADSLASALPGIPADKLEMLREMPELDADLPGMWEIRASNYSPYALKRPQPWEWKPAEVSARSLNIKYDAYEITLPKVFKPSVIKVPRKIDPLNYVERTERSWWPYTFDLNKPKHNVSGAGD